MKTFHLKLCRLFCALLVAAHTCSAPAGAINAGGAVKPQTLADFLKIKDCSIQLVGDGHDTSNCQINIVDKATGKVLCTATLSTLCIGRKTQRPPTTIEEAQKLNLVYQLGARAPRTLTRVVTAAISLDAQGKLNALPIDRAHRVRNIAQLAVWQSMFGKAPGSKDSINMQTIKDDLLNQAQIDPKAMRKKDREALDNILNDRAAAICSAVDDTCEYSGVVSAASKPSDAKIAPAVVTLESESDSEFEGAVKAEDIPPGSVLIPAGATFAPNDELFQIMMLIQKVYLQCLNDSTTHAGSVSP